MVAVENRKLKNINTEVITKLKYTLLALLGFISLRAQVNLVPNPSFEEHYQIPSGTSQIYYCQHWFSATGGGGTPDYFSTFSNGSNVDIPENTYGYEDAEDGDFYAGIFIYHGVFSFAVEYIECKLIQPLLPKRYCVEFYVSLADSTSRYAVNNIGLFFSPDSIYTDTIRRLVEFTPQFININNPLTNKIGWTKISGSFVAQGGEQYMVMGNFNLPENDDTVQVPGYEGLGANKSGYIYIDSVSVQLCDEVGIGENELEKIEIYPNPAQDFVNIDIPTNYQKPQLSIYNLTGQLISQSPITSNQPIPISKLSNGLYLFVIQSGDKVIGRQRVVVAR